MKKLLALAIAFAGLACAQSQPHVTVFHMDSAACATMHSLLGVMAPPVCQQNVQVSAWDSDGQVTAFVAVIVYTDLDGNNQRSQSGAAPASTSNGNQVGLILFNQDMSDVKIVSVTVTAQESSGESVTVTQ